jgi:tetratricopeptide (TPR) repeat protein
MSTISLQKAYENEWQLFTPVYPPEIYEKYCNICEEWDSNSNANPNDLINELILIIDKYPDFLDAYSILGTIFTDCDRKDLSHKIWRVAGQMLLQAIPNSFDFQKDKLNYYILSNRTFFRSYFNLGFTYFEDADDENIDFLRQANLKVAAEIFQNLVNIHHNDNIGARDLLIPCYLGLGEYEKVLEVCKLYESEDEDVDNETCDPNILYGRVLAALKLKKRPKAKQWLQIAIERRPLVAQILLKENPKQPINYYTDVYTSGGADEAYRYWQMNYK